MSKALKKSTKNKGIIKVNKKVRKVTDKSGCVLLKDFLLLLLGTQRSYWSNHPLHKYKQLRGFPVFRSGCNELYDQNILPCRLLGLVIGHSLLFSDYLQHINEKSKNFFLLPSHNSPANLPYMSFSI